MGMAASQARLLTITARLADNELKSQTINNAKMRLAAQSSQASENYINALNNATMKFSSYDLEGNALIQDLTFNALTAYSSYNTQYGLVNASNQILVSEAEAKMFEDAHGNLNAYLKAHGLEFTTTYFDNLGALTNEKYPEPFNNNSPEALKIYYEQYGSYENSVERENYERSYSNYKTASSLLAIAAKESLRSYLTYSGNSKPISYNEGKFSLNFDSAGSIYSAYQIFNSAFTGSNNTYSPDTLKNNNFITDSSYNAIKDLLSSFSMQGSQLKYGTVLDNGADGALQKIVNEEAGSITYNFNDKFSITTDMNGVVTVGATQIETGATMTFTDKSGNAMSTGQSLNSYLNNLKFTYSTTDDAGNTNTQNFFFEANGNQYKQYCLINDLNQAKELLNNAVNTILSEVVTSANYEGFADWMLTNRASLGTYGINPDSKIEKAGNKTVSEVLNSYLDTKKTFINNIFDDNTPVTVDGVSYASSYAYIEQGMTNGTIDAATLTEIDTVLKLIKEKGLIQSENYNTVIKQFIVEEMIEVNGETKYAWIDENDTSNTGNADAKAQWYTNLFQRMTKGYKALENGLAKSKEWIEYALESGIVSMEQVDKSFNWKGLTYKTCTRITEETDNDAVTKAEAEYNRAMNDIEAKDNIYDIQLKNIDTEHSSLQAEYDSIKGVISKNIDRTFKFNQSA